MKRFFIFVILLFGAGVLFFYSNKDNSIPDSVGMARLIESSEKQNSFVDMDFSNENVGGFGLDKYNFNRIKDMERDGEVYYRVWAIRREKDSKYSKYLMVVGKHFVLVGAGYLTEMEEDFKCCKACIICKLTE